MNKLYETIIKNSNFADHGLVRGTFFLHPKSCFVWEQIQNFINKEFEKAGIENVLFSSLMPTSELEKEKEKLNGFLPELFHVKASSETEDKWDMFLRPTSEIAFSHFFKKQLEKTPKLPILLNQWVSVFRSEKNTKLFFRNCEFHWQEAHTIHETTKDAYKYLEIFNSIYKKLIKNCLLIAFLNGEKTIQERFLGSEKTLTVEGIMPDGQSLQMATSHFLAQNFSKIFKIQYIKNNKNKEFPFQLSAGCSTRLLGALIISHSDKKGIVLPWHLSKIKIKILVLENAVSENDNFYKKVNLQLKNFNCEWDFSNKSFGKKITESEINGIPMNLIIGPEEIKNNYVTIKSRIQNKKEKVNLNDLKKILLKQKQIFNKQLFKNSEDNLKNMIKKEKNLEGVVEAVKNKKTALVPWLDDAKNEENFKLKNYNFGPRCILKKIKPSNKVKCFYSQKPANCYAYFGRSY